MNTAVEKKWLQLKALILSEIATSDAVECHIPGWDPVDLNMGLRWAQSSIYEGFHVGFTVLKEPPKAIVEFTISEADFD